VEYAAPTTVEDAQTLLASNTAAQLFAGATDLIPQMRAGRPAPLLAIDLKRIPRLMDIRLEGDTWIVGASTPAARIAEEHGFADDFPGLAEAASLIGSDQIQSRASLGGNLCNASPAADTVPAMVVNDVQAVIATRNGTRVVPALEIVTGPGTTSLAAGELLVELRVTRPERRTADAYLRFTPRSEMDIAVVGAGARITLEADGSVGAADIALGAVAPTVVRLAAAEQILKGRPIDKAALGEIAIAASEAANPIDDKRGTKEYRRHVAGVLARRAVQLAVVRAEETL
jgi:carbon-monoxide dehydrogenase medium subunit